MGCGNSSPVHPSIYNETIGKQQKANGILKTPKPVRESNPNHLTGDYSQYQVAKHQREMSQKDRQIKVFMAADEMTGRLIEEREMLSLGTRSRGTSRNTSRGTSPTGNKRNQDIVVPMTHVTEGRQSRGTSVKSETELPHDASPKKKLKTHKRSKNKGKSKGKKHRKGKKSKRSKDKSSKDVDETDEDLDSGVDEDENGDDDATNSDKENKNIETVMNANDIRNNGISHGNAISERQSDSTDKKSKHNTHRSGSPTPQNHAKHVTFQSSSNDSGIVINSSSNTTKLANSETDIVNMNTKL